jgi:hypothetical protein
MHDRVTAEFVNVGIVVFQPDSNFLQGKFVSKFSRISQFFININGQYLLSTLRQFEKELEIASSKLSHLPTICSSLNEITNLILPKDDSALICSELFFGIDVEPQYAIDDLFDRLVNKYNNETENEYRDDKYVWRKVYKQYFDKYEITDKLKPHTVKTNNDYIEFDKAWKNGVWNCYQTLSFDLKRHDSIKNKVYRWSGILSELENSDHELHLYFLTMNPINDKTINKFIDDAILKHNSGQSLKVTIVKEKQADKFVSGVKKEIEEHQKNL